MGGDHDWFRITLSAGESISVVLNGLGAAALTDPNLRIRDSSGTLIFENDDGGTGLNSRIAFQATYSGTYYIDVAAWDDAAGTYKYTGDYQLQISAYTPPPIGTIPDIANELTSGYWDGSSHHFAVTQGGFISVHLTALTADGQYLARQALQQWSGVIGVTFQEATSGGQIIFDDNETGASTSAVWSQGVETSAHVNISTQWLTDYGTSIGTYAFQTYLHEIGHALGLGHAGNYNGEATFPYDALFLNDAWSNSVMSYFSPRENTYFAGLGFTPSYLGTPMVADILAMSQLYGLSTTTRLGNTTYGFNSNASNDVYNATLYPRIAYTVFDSGGTDTLDYSGFGQNQTIDLTAGTFSNIGGRTGNVSIALGTVIENAIGGAGSDTIRGNEADNVLTGNGGDDALYGFGGNDTLVGGAGNDRIDGGDGFDTASYADALAGITVNNQTVTSVGNAAGIGSDDLFDIERIVGSAFNDIFTGGPTGQRFEGGAGNDIFTGGGGADILVGGAGADLFRDTVAGLNGDTIVDFTVGDRIEITDANFSTFTYSLSGTTLTYSGGSLTFGSALTSGLVVRAVTGGTGVSLALASAPFANETFRLADFGADAGAGSWTSDDRFPRLLADVNGDGRADIVGFGNDGVFVSLGTSDGTFAPKTLVTTSFGAAPGAGGWSSNDVYLRVMADVNGDGRADIVGFGNDGVYVSLATIAAGSDPYAGASVSYSTAVSFGPTTLVSTAFGAAASAGGWNSNDHYLRQLADVNGDGRADIVGFGNDGVYVSLNTGNGSFAAPTLATTAFGAAANAGGWDSNDHYLRQLADVNGDGRADIVGFGNSGVYVALANANGTFNAPTLSLAQFGAAASGGGWTSDNLFPRELADVNGDGKVDIVGFGYDGVFVALGRGDGTFAESRLDLRAFGVQPAAGGWSSEDLYPRHLADVNHDGAADIVGFAGNGVHVSLSNGDMFI